MSIETDEDTELRDLVAGTLQSSGVLGKIKAQLRSSVYLALDGGGKPSLKNSSSPINDFVRNSEGRLALQLVFEFLDFFGLHFTASVFEPEAIEGRDVICRSRQDLVERLGLASEVVHDDQPLLAEVIRLSKVSMLKSETESLTSVDIENEESSLRTSIDTHKSSPNSRHPASTTPTQIFTPESSLNALPTPKAAGPAKCNGEAFVGGVSPPPDETSTDNRQKPKQPSKSPLEAATSGPSFLSDLPPLGGTVAKPANVLAPLRKPPPLKTENHGDFLDSVYGQKDNKQASNQDVANRGSAFTASEDTFTKDGEIEEEIDEDFNVSEDISISASEGFTKDESVGQSELGTKFDYSEDLNKAS